LITSLPYVIGFEVQGDDWVFSGFVFGVEDGNSYIAKMKLGMEGDWLFRTPYTVMPQRGTLAFLPYLILGKLASPPAAHLQLVSLFHFMATFLEEAAWRLWATALATLGGGLGWMLLLIGRTFDGSQPPLEFISPETFGFLAYLGLPHIALGRGLLLLALRAYLVGASGSRKGWLGGLALLAAGLAQPLALVAGFVAIGAHHCLWLVVKGRAGIQAWRHRWLRRAACRRVCGLDGDRSLPASLDRPKSHSLSTTCSLPAGVQPCPAMGGLGLTACRARGLGALGLALGVGAGHTCAGLLAPYVAAPVPGRELDGAGSRKGVGRRFPFSQRPDYPAGG